MQNKANFRKSQMNVTKVLTMEYKNKTLSRSGKNKANSKPNKANLLNAQMNVNKVLTKDYENKPPRPTRKNKANSKPNKANFKKAQMNVNKVLTKDYENKPPRPTRKNKANTNPIQTQSNPISPPHAAKQTQYKPNQTQFQRQNYNRSFLKRHLQIVKKIQFFLRFLLYYCAYSDILLHISEDITLCS